MDGEKSDSDSDGCNQLFFSDGCNNRPKSIRFLAQAAELKPMPQSWRGVLPCADCEGIEISLFLEKDGTWVMNERYRVLVKTFLLRFLRYMGANR